MKTYGGPRYVIGGAHGRTSVAENIEAKIALGEEPPQRWVNWPCKVWWVPGGPEEYHKELITIGTFDNVSVRRDISFVDKLRGIRREFIRYWGSYEKYEEWRRNAQGTDSKRRTMLLFL
jgi:hypothetical protein